MGMLPIAILFILFIFNIPVAYCLLISTASYFLFINTSIPVDMIFQRMIASAESFPLLAIPFFITAGSIMNYAGISKRLMAMAEVLAGHLVGGLAQVNVVLSVLMAGVSGSANADTAMQCKMLVPEMIKRGYSKPFSAAITAASATISPIIPPGIALILYAFIANVSVGKMFLAGYIPGLLMAVGLMIVVYFISKKRNFAPSRDKQATFKEVIDQLKKSGWALFLPLGIILGLRFGMFTPTEAGAMAAFYAALIGIFIYKELKLEHIPHILLESLLGTSSVMFIITAASAFGFYLSWERIPHTIASFLMEITSDPVLFLLIVNILLLFIGMFIEGTASLIILAPLLIPVASQLGIDLIHFGIIMVINITIGGVTPPFGSLMFLASSLLEIKIIDFIKEGYPFILALIVVLFIITYVPILTTFLPSFF